MFWLWIDRTGKVAIRTTFKCVLWPDLKVDVETHGWLTVQVGRPTHSRHLHQQVFEAGPCVKVTGRLVRVQQQVKDDGQVLHGNVTQEPSGPRFRDRCGALLAVPSSATIGTFHKLLQKDVIEVLQENLMGQETHHNGSKRDPMYKTKQRWILHLGLPIGFSTQFLLTWTMGES